MHRKRSLGRARFRIHVGRISNIKKKRLRKDKIGSSKILTVLSLIMIVASVFTPILVAEQTGENYPDDIDMSSSDDDNSRIEDVNVECYTNVSLDMNLYSKNNTLVNNSSIRENKAALYDDENKSLLYFNCSNDNISMNRDDSDSMSQLNMSLSGNFSATKDMNFSSIICSNGTFSHNTTNSSIENSKINGSLNFNLSEDDSRSEDENQMMDSDKTVASFENSSYSLILDKINGSLSRRIPVFLIIAKNNTDLYKELEKRYDGKISFIRVNLSEYIKIAFNLSFSSALFLIKSKNESGYLYLEIDPDIEVEKLDSILYFAANNIFAPTSYGIWYRDKKIYHRMFPDINPDLHHINILKMIQPAINRAWRYLDPYKYIGTNKMDATMFSAFKILYTNFRKDPKILRAYRDRVFNGKKRIADKYLYQLNFFFNLNLSEDRYAQRVIEGDFLQSGMLTINELILRAFYSDEVPFTDDMFEWVLNNFSKRGGYDLTHSIMVYAILRERRGYDAEKIRKALDELCNIVVEEQEEDHSKGAIADFDLYAERVAFLIIADRCDLIKDEWIEKIISFQNKDGGFPISRYGERSHAHSTYVALLALMGYKKYVLEHKQFDFSFTKSMPLKKPYTDSRFSTKFLEELDKKGKVRGLIKIKHGDIPPWLDEIFGKGNLTIIDTNRGTFVSVEVTKDLLDDLLQRNDIDKVLLDEDISYSLSEALPVIEFNKVSSQFNYSGKGIRICILDTGLNSSYVDFNEGYDFVDDDPYPEDENGHGTQIALIIKSMAPNVTIIPIKVLNDNGRGLVSTALEGLNYAIDLHPDIIVMAFGGGSYSGFCNDDPLANLSNYAVEQGIFVIASTGNDGSKNITSPACGVNVFRVSATDDNDNIAPFANVNPTVDIFAPGMDITTQLGTYSGTSMSVGFVAGAAALLMEKEKGFSVDEIKYRLRSTGRPIHYVYNSSISCNIPRLNVYNALINNITMMPYNYNWWRNTAPQEYEVIGMHAPVISALVDIEGGGDTTPPSSSVNDISPYWQTSSPITITATASDDSSGVAFVELYYMYSSSGSIWTSWTLYGKDTASPWSWSFDFPNGDGHYAFASKAYDNAGNAESLPTNPDTECGYDTTPPASSVDSISPYWQSSSPLTITASASDSTSGVKQVALYYRYSSDNSSWGSWTSFGTDSSSPWSWSFDFPSGEGYYQFYSIAEDNAGNTESAPASADAICGYDATPPASSVNPISPYWQTTSPITITADAHDSGLSGVKQVTLFYRYSSDNATWGDPNWWNTSWQYFRVININSNSYSGYYQMQINVTYSGNDNALASPPVISCNGHCNQNFSDLRFVQIDNSTVLPYWLEMKVDGNYAIVWVNVSSQAMSDGKILMYYGNPSATDASNGDATFLFFDDMEVWSGWTRYGSGLVSQDSTRDYDGIYSAHKTTANDPNGAYKLIGQTLGRDIILEFWVNRNSGYSGGSADRVGLLNAGNDGYGWVFSHSSDYVGIDKRTDYSGSVLTSSSATDYMDKWVFARFIIKSDGGLTAERYVDGSLSGSVSYTDSTYTSFNRVYIFGGYDYWVDQMRIRKYASPEPSWNNFGNEHVYGWMIFETDSIGSDGWSWNFNFPNGTGYYEFYSIATDVAGNVESAPASADAICGYDNSAPTVTVIYPNGGEIVRGTINIQWSTDDTNKDTVKIECSPDGGLTWYTVVSSTPDDGSYPVDTTEASDGSNYKIRVTATDKAGNTGSDTSDSTFTIDNTAPTSQVDSISPYWQSSSPLTITASASDSTSGVKQVTLYYRYSSDNSSWGSWQSFGTDTASPWSWSFNFPSSQGYYQFYSIAEDNASNVESAPASADAECYYNPSTNTPPTISNEYPANGSTRVSIQPTCRIQVNDSDGDTLTVYWYENTTGDWVLRNVNNSVSANSTVSFKFVQFNSYGTTYYWKVAVNDGTDNVTAIYHFTTNYLPSVSNVIITASHNFTLDNLIGSGTYYDADDDPESGSLYQWWTNESGAWQKIPGATSKILDANLTKEGCWYKFEYTPCDGANYGNSVNSTPFQVRPLTETATYSGKFNISGNLTVANGGTLYLGTSTLTVENTVKILNGGIFNGGSGTHTFGSLIVESGGIFNATTGITYLNNKDSNGYVLDIDGTIINNSGTVEIDSSGSVYMDANPSSGSLFDLVIKLGSQTSKVLLRDACIVGGNLTIDDGILDTNNNILSVKDRLYILSGGELNCTGDNVDHKVGSLYLDTFSSFKGSSQSRLIVTSQYGGLSLNILGDFISNGESIELRTTESSRINVNPSSGGLYNLIINSSSIVEWEGSLNILNNLTIISGTLRPFVGSNDITVGNTVDINGGTLGGNSASGIWTFGSIIQSSGTIYATSKFINITGKSNTGYAVDLDGIFINNSCVIRIKSSSDASIDISPSSGNLYDLVIDTGSYKITSIESSVISNNLSILSGTFDLKSDLDVGNVNIGTNCVFNITNDATLSMDGTLTLNGDFNIIDGNATGINLGGTLFDLLNAVNISIQNVVGIPSDPPNLRNIGKYVNITSCGSSSIVDINITYSDLDLGTVDESSLKMYEYNSSTSTWSIAPNTGVNVSTNHVWAIGVTSFSIYAPLGETQNNPPTINSIDLRNDTGSKLNSDQMIDVNKEYYFLVNVTDPDGWQDIEYINITAWYDQGNESSYYNQTQGGNLNLFLQYKNITGSAEYKLIWPSSEVELVLANCSETIINSTTREIKIAFKPKSQFRYAPGDGTWNSTVNATDDPYSWNINISIEDNSSARSWVKSEFGVYRYVNIEVPSNWIGVSALPGYYDDSNVVTITFSSNYDYKLSIWFSTDLVNQSTGSVIPIANNVYALANADPNDDITTDTVFSGTGEGNAIEIINASGTFNPNGTYQTVNVQFRVYIPFGTLSGEYRANTHAKLEQKP